MPCFISLCSVFCFIPLSLSLSGQASESWWRQTRPLSGAAMLSLWAAQACLCFLPLPYFSALAALPCQVAREISETRDNERCKWRQQFSACKYKGDLRRCCFWKRRRVEYCITLAMESYGEVREIDLRATVGSLTWTFVLYVQHHSSKASSQETFPVIQSLSHSNVIVSSDQTTAVKE